MMTPEEQKAQEDKDALAYVLGGLTGLAYLTGHKLTHNFRKAVERLIDLAGVSRMFVDLICDPEETETP